MQVTVMITDDRRRALDAELPEALSLAEEISDDMLLCEIRRQ